MTKKIFATLLGGTLLLALSACANEIEEPSAQKNDDIVQTEESQDSQEPLDEKDVIRLGGILPLSGESGAYGTSMQKIAEIALAEINEDGGINGKKMVIRWEDGKCNAEEAANAATSLIDNEKVSIIYGGFCNAETLAIAPLAEKAGVVVLSPASSSPDISKAGEYIFSNYPSDSDQGKLLASAASDKSYKKVAILTEDDAYNLGIQSGFQEKMNELQGTVETETYSSDTSDLKPQLEKLKASTPDALFINPQTPAKADLALKQLKEMDWQVPLIGNDIVAGYQDLTIKHQDLVENMIVALYHPKSDSDRYAVLAEKYKEQTGEVLPYETYASTAYDAVYLLRDALLTQGYDAAKIRDYLAAIRELDGLGAAYSIEEIKEGKVLTAE